MNRSFAILLALIFFFGIGTFNIAKGISSIRSRRESTVAGWIRIVLGVLLLALLVPLVWTLKQS